MAEVPMETHEANVWNWLVAVPPLSPNQIVEEIGLFSRITSNHPLQRKGPGDVTAVLKNKK